MGKLFGKVITFIFQYTIGLVLPWWFIDGINSLLLHGYRSKFTNFKKIYRFTFGLILPWWLLLIIEGNRMDKTEGSVWSDSNGSDSSYGKVLKDWTCKQCSLIVNAKFRPYGNEFNQYGVCPNHPNYPGAKSHNFYK